MLTQLTPKIIFEDESLIVLDKPSGVTVNNADTTRGQETVQGWITSVKPELFQSTKSFKKDLEINKTQPTEYNVEEEFYNRGGIVHRLDKETSGILLIAKNPDSFQKLKEQFMTRIVKKTYIALAHGKILPMSGEINAPVGRLPFNRTHFGVVAGGREAMTLYNVKKYYDFSISKKNKEILSFVELYPQTGRTHQIRVHLKYLGHPIFADELYAGRKVAREDRKYLPRLFLHANKISFIHPITEKQTEFICPLPVELKSFLSNLTEVPQ
jgi:RluA family pseudouridine synthase